MQRWFYIALVLVFSINSNCQNENMKHKYTNHLINETSPYLLQHAHNPVDWYPWGKEALEKAQKENKPLIISIGYSTCHWCHVMERESFENEEIARIMNENFVCIKVDREERPDIDKIYMSAVEMMTGRGGWPLNCFALPDGTPFFGGSYFPPQQWKSILLQIANQWKTNPTQIILAAQQVKNRLVNNDLVKMKQETGKIFLSKIMQAVEKWKHSFDPEYGGNNTRIKFPMPVIYNFLLDYYFYTGDKEILTHVETTLDRMAVGGIYDHIGGGFARYSTDKQWRVPHFEKMLYDNAQLIDLYSNAYKLTGKEKYKQVVTETIDFLMREMHNRQGYFYSALDADSEGEEGKFYVWTYEELKKLVPQYLDELKAVYEISPFGNWEGKIIFYQKHTLEKAAQKLNISVEQLQADLASARQILFEYQNKRVHPSTDTKAITSWNAMTISGLISAYTITGNNDYLNIAKQTASFITNTMLDKDTLLWRTYKDNIRKIPGYLDDYAFTIKAMTDLFITTGEEKYLSLAEKLTQYVFDHFLDRETGMFFYTADNQPTHIKREKDITDNVIPSSNSVMAYNLFILPHIGHYPEWKEHSYQMLLNVSEYLYQYPGYFALWEELAFKQGHSFYELAICGDKAKEYAMEVMQKFLPNTVVVFTEKPSQLPIFQDRFVKGKNLFYVCVDNTCQLPVTTTDAALKLLKK